MHISNIAKKNKSLIGDSLGQQPKSNRSHTKLMKQIAHKARMHISNITKKNKNLIGDSLGQQPKSNRSHTKLMKQIAHKARMHISKFGQNYTIGGSK